MAEQTESKATTPASATPTPKRFSIASWASYTPGEEGVAMRERLMALKARSIKRQSGTPERVKTAGLFADGQLGNANIADSDNIGYYSFEFPVDSLEMPQSRPEELRFYRLAYD